jgi:hypothetical protein
MNSVKRNDSQGETRHRTAIYTSPCKVKFALVVEYINEKKVEHVVEYTELNILKGLELELIL